jgi:hypothetical protein
MDKCSYIEILFGIMKSVYLSTRSRPDTPFAVSALFSRCQDPKVSDMDRIARKVLYLKRAQDEYLVLKHGG